MLRDANDYNGDPGIAVLLTGDGKGFYDGIGFHSDVERMHRKGWRIEILSWADSCNARMREWAEQNGVFVALDDFYNSVTYLAPSNADYPGADPRPSIPLDLTPRSGGQIKSSPRPTSAAEMNSRSIRTDKRFRRR